MKNKRVEKFIIVGAIIIMIGTNFAAIVSGNKTSEETFTYLFEHPSIEKINIEGIQFDRIHMKDTSYDGAVGEPNLPSKGIYLLIPQGRTIQSIDIIPQDLISVGSSNYSVEPVRIPIPTSQPEEASPLIKNENIYSSDNSFPENPSLTIGIQQCKGYQILIISLRPMIYHPLTGRLLFYQKITITVNTVEGKNDAILFRGLKKDNQAVMTMVDNPITANTYNINKNPISNNYDLLILTTNSLKSGFKRLADAHNKDGIRTMIKSIEEIDCSTPEEIRNYIRDEYMNYGIDYVLIGGDQDIVPAKLLYFGEYYGPVFAPSDFYYGCLDGSFNGDGDNKCGEPNDGDRGGDVDLMAEVYVGRACVGNLTEVGYFVNKTLAYMNTPRNDNYLKKVVLVGQYLCGPLEGMPLTFGDQYMEELIDKSTNNGYTTVGIPSNFYSIDRLYDGNWPGWNPNDPWMTGWPLAELIKRINSGVQIIDHLGHSERFYNMKFDVCWRTDEIDQLTNEKPCFIYSQGCSAGAFDKNASEPFPGHNYTIPDCIAEYFTAKRPHGAFAGIWNAREGWYMPGGTDSDSQRYNRWFWDGVFHKGYFAISRANQYSKEMNIPSIHYNQIMRWCCYGLNLFGDPAIAIRNRPAYIGND